MTTMNNLGRNDGTASSYRSSKILGGYPCAHRNHLADSHCSFIHGYDRYFKLNFAAHSLTKEGFVVDFASLKGVKRELDSLLDHTLLLNTGDPLIPNMREVESLGGCKLVVIPEGYNVGMEGTAALFGEIINKQIRYDSKSRAWLESIEAIENNKNAATWLNLEGWLGWKSHEDIDINNIWNI